MRKKEEKEGDERKKVRLKVKKICHWIISKTHKTNVKLENVNTSYYRNSTVKHKQHPEQENNDLIILMKQRTREPLKLLLEELVLLRHLVLPDDLLLDV